MSAQTPFEPLELANRIADCYRPFSAVQAVAWSDPGTQADIDLYVFTTQPITLHDRDRIADRVEVSPREGLAADTDCDKWLNLESRITIDLTYWDPAWIEEQIARVLEQHEPALGFTTTFWHTILNAEILYDKNGWLSALKTRCSRPYPEELRIRIIARNHAALRGSPAAYQNQIEKAVQRDDLVSIQHHITALLASYFDVLFALNSRPHPGERRLLENAAQLPQQPVEMETDVRALLRACQSPIHELLPVIQRLLDRLDTLLVQAGFDPQTSLPAG